jgi:hypothetical protein
MGRTPRKDSLVGRLKRRLGPKAMQAKNDG